MSAVVDTPVHGFEESQPGIHGGNASERANDVRVVRMAPKQADDEDADGMGVGVLVGPGRSRFVDKCEEVGCT